MKARAVYDLVFSASEKLYDSNEGQSIAMAYLQDRWEIDRMQFSLNVELQVDHRILENDLKKLRDGVPLQHIVGFQEFYGYRFFTNENALIPRPETEELVHWVLDDLKTKTFKQSESSTPKLLDIGTGTGCIPICIDLSTDNLSCHGLDVSQRALQLAETNANRLKSDATFWQLDILANDLPESSYDFIISNPPYIPEKEKVSMHKNVLAFEPELALFVPDSDPLLFYRTIAQKAVSTLKKDGLLYFEIHEAFSQEVVYLLKTLDYREIVVKQDLQGKDRMIRAQKGV